MSKKIYTFILFVFSICILMFFGYYNKMPEVNFSMDSGFYNDSFYLKLESNTFSGTIYYTLDGSDPNTNSIEYKEPIYIYDATKNPNVYSSRTDVSVTFYTDLIKEYCIGYENYDEPMYKIPTNNVDKCTIVRAICIDQFGRTSEITTKCYFIGYKNKDNYQNANIINIVTDPDNLFDSEKGIYVTGEHFEKEKVNLINGTPLWKRDYYPNWECNYNDRTMVAKDGYIECYEGQNLILTQPIKIKIHGGWSRAASQKGLNLYSVDRNGIETPFNYNFFNNDFYPTAITLTAGGDDTKTKSVDYLVNNLTDKLNYSVTKYRPCIVFLDGEYWGLYYLSEKYDENYINYHYGVDKENIIMIKSGSVEVGEGKDISYHKEMLDFCENTDFNDTNNITKLETIIDLDSYIDYYASLAYIGRSEDWPTGNYALWRTIKKENNEYGDCRWRWMLYDVNSPTYLKTGNVEFDSIEYIRSIDKMFDNIMKNDKIRHKFINRLLELGKEVYTSNNTKTILSEFIDNYKTNILLSNKRYYDDYCEEEFDNQMNNYYTFIDNRLEYLITCVEKYQ